MISTSAAFRAAIRQNTKVALRATLEFADGTTSELTGADLAMGGLSVTEATTTVGSFDVGSAVAGTCDLTLQNYSGQWDDADFTDCRFVPYVGVTLSGGTTEWIRRGTYRLEQPESYGSTIRLTGMDNMRLLQRPYSEVGTTYPATLRTIVREVCEECGLVMLAQTFDNDTYVVQEDGTSSADTCLDVLSWAAQAAGCLADCDPYGRLRVRWYDGTFEDDGWWEDGAPAGWDGEEPYHVTAVSRLTTSTDDVVITGVRVTASDELLEDGSAGEAGETHLHGTEGYVLDIGDNPLVRHGQASAVAAMIGARVCGMRFRPLEVTCLGNPALEAGDPIVVTDQKGRDFLAYATTLTWRAGGYATLTCDAETPARRSAEGASAGTRAMVQLRERLRAERTARDLAIGTLAEQLADSAGLYCTEELQQDGSVIYYAHDKATLGDSTIVWKFTAEALGISTDGGTTYAYGLDATGAAVLSRIYAIGLDASYVNTGRLLIGNAANPMFLADFDAGVFSLNTAAMIGDRTIGDTLDKVDATSEELASAVQTLETEIDDARKVATNWLSYDQATGALALATMLNGAVGEVSTVVMPTGLHFQQNNADVAYLARDAADAIWKLFIEYAQVVNTLRFGDFAWIARSNGNMTIKWVG